MSAAPALVVLQARTGSTRLPDKVLAPIEGTTVIERCLRRLVSSGVGPVVLATTTLSADDALETLAAKLGVTVVRGPDQDVLARYVLAAESWAGPHLIRATADNPLVDPGACARVLQHLRQGADYISEKNLPVGAAVEGMTISALRLAGREATAPHDREHVTPWLRRAHDRLDVREVEAPQGLSRPDLRFTLDTADDLAYLREVVAIAGVDCSLALTAYIAAADRICVAQPFNRGPLGADSVRRGDSAADRAKVAPGDPA